MEGFRNSYKDLRPPHTFTVKMTTVMFHETSIDLQQSTSPRKSKFYIKFKPRELKNKHYVFLVIPLKTNNIHCCCYVAEPKRISWWMVLGKEKRYFILKHWLCVRVCGWNECQQNSEFSLLIHRMKHVIIVMCGGREIEIKLCKYRGIKNNNVHCISSKRFGL